MPPLLNSSPPVAESLGKFQPLFAVLLETDVFPNDYLEYFRQKIPSAIDCPEKVSIKIGKSNIWLYSMLGNNVRQMYSCIIWADTKSKLIGVLKSMLQIHTRQSLSECFLWSRHFPTPICKLPYRKE